MKALTSFRFPAPDNRISFFKTLAEGIYDLGHGKLHAFDLALSLGLHT